MNFFNPFTKVLQEGSHPHAGALQTSFDEKFELAAQVIAGNCGLFMDMADYWIHQFVKEDRPPYQDRFLGIYDYLTLGLPYLLETVLGEYFFFVYKLIMPDAKQAEDYPWWRTILSRLLLTALIIVPAFIGYLSQSLRIVFTGVALLLSLPIIGLVHAVSRWIAAPLEADAAFLDLGNGKTYGEYMEEPNHNPYRNFMIKVSNNRVVMERNPQPGVYLPFFVKSTALLSERDKLALKAIYRLNAGEVAKHSPYYEKRLSAVDKYQGAKAKNLQLSQHPQVVLQRAAYRNLDVIRAYLQEQCLELEALDLSDLSSYPLLKVCLENLPPNIIYLDLSWNASYKSHSHFWDGESLEAVIDSMVQLLSLIPPTVTGICLGANGLNRFNEAQLQRIITAIPATVMDIDFEECERAEQMIREQPKLNPYLDESIPVKVLQNLVAGYVGRDVGFFAVTEPAEAPPVARAQALGF